MNIKSKTYDFVSDVETIINGEVSYGAYFNNKQYNIAHIDEVAKEITNVLPFENAIV